MKYLLLRIFIYLLPSGTLRTRFIKKFDIFLEIGEDFYFCPRKLPADPKLIKFHNNISVAAEVQFVNHDVTQKLFNNLYEEEVPKFYGCIEIMDNVFIGSRSMILPNVKIGPDVIIGAGTLVNKSISQPGIYAGIPAHKIGEIEELYHKRLVYKNEVYCDNMEDYHKRLWKEFERIQNKYKKE